MLRPFIVALTASIALLGVYRFVPHQSSTKGVRTQQAARSDETQRAQKKKAAPEPQTVSAVEYPKIASTRISPGDNQSDFPSAVVTSSGEIWAAWVEWDGRDSDQIVVRNLAWEANHPVLVWRDGNSSHHAPVLVARGDRILCAWTARVGEDWEIFAGWIESDGKLGAPQRLTRAPGSDLSPRLVCDRDGKITLAWQAFRNGKSDIIARQLRGERWGRELRVSSSSANDWEPDLVADPAGAVHIVWDSYETGDYNVYARTLKDESLGPLLPVANSTAAEFHAAAACDTQGRLWVVYDIAGENWGKDFSRGSNVAAPGSGGLHQSRQIGLRVLSREGIAEPAANLSAVLKDRMARFAELATLAFDGDGAPWLVFRHWTNTAPTEIYHFYATRLTAEGWMPPAQLENSAGRNTQRASLVRRKDGILQAIYSSDARDQSVEPLLPEKARTYRIHAAALPRSNRSSEPALHPVQLEKERPAAVPRSRYSTTIGGRRYHLLYGDLHRHTDIRGHSGVDGSLLDTYRYALDAAELDFLGPTDHNQVAGGRWPDGLRDYQWWWVRKAADMFTNAPAFNGMYAYEHSLATPSGHRNIVFLDRSAPLRLADRERVKDDNLPTRLWDWMRGVLKGPGRQKAVIIPHTIAERTQPKADWNWENPEFEPVLEIYQGARSSYETGQAGKGEKRGQSQLEEPGHFAQDALNKGFRYGFIASSDHGSTHNSYACVYVKEASREGILEGLLARRTFAASDDIILDATLNGHAMGEEFGLNSTPELKIYVRARNDIVRIDVVRDGKFIYTSPGQGREFRGSFRDREVGSGKHYYYVRVIQRDIEAPEGDPEMAWGSPFFVTLR